MEMNEILNGLNSCGGNENIAPQCPPQNGPFNCGGGCGGFGGFGSWIWILLILFYSGGFGGGNGNNNRCCCKQEKCCCKKERDCCCSGNSGYGNTGFGGCSNWLFLLVILFLCNGCSGFGNCGNGNLFGGFC